MKRTFFAAAICLCLLTGQAGAESYPIVDTGQTACFDDRGQTRCPERGDTFFGQDAQYKGNVPRYKDNGDGTVSDLVTGLMWVQSRGQKMPWQQAVNSASACRVGGHTDWRAPTIKELYSLIDFMGWTQRAASSSRPFIDTRYFQFAYGNAQQGERFIDCQDWSSTLYVSTTMGGQQTAFGVNFADGRIKGYPTRMLGHQGKSGGKYIRYVRGNPEYGKNAFVDNRDGTITDRATGLRWQKRDSEKAMNWKDALSYCENMNRAGTTEWRLPTAKELQSIVDYTRSPASTGSAAIDPVFFVTKPESYFWSSTTHMDGPRHTNAAYVAFGRAMGYFAPPRSNQAKRFLDVHGAGAQRSDPKSGNPSKYPQGHGPQGDDVRILNYARCVTGGGVSYYQPENKPLGQFKHNVVDGNMHQGMQGGGPGKGGKPGGWGMMKNQQPPQSGSPAPQKPMSPGQFQEQGMQDSGSAIGDSGQVGFGQQNMQFGQPGPQGQQPHMGPQGQPPHMGPQGQPPHMGQQHMGQPYGQPMPGQYGQQPPPPSQQPGQQQQYGEQYGQPAPEQHQYGAQYGQPAPPAYGQEQQQQYGQQPAQGQQAPQSQQNQQGTVSGATCGGIPIGGQCTANTPYGPVQGICRSKGPSAACVPAGRPPAMPGMQPGMQGGPQGMPPQPPMQ